MHLFKLVEPTVYNGLMLSFLICTGDTISSESADIPFLACTQAVFHLRRVIPYILSVLFDNKQAIHLKIFIKKNSI